MKSNIFTIVACLVYVDGKILLLKRHPEKSQGGLWALPAGKVEEGESEAEAIVRELAEETGRNWSIKTGIILMPKNRMNMRSLSTG